MSKAPDLPDTPRPIAPAPSTETFAVGDKVRIMADENPEGTITEIKAGTMAHVMLPGGAERYVPFGFLAKVG